MIWFARASRARRWRRGEWALLAEGWLALGVAYVAVRRWRLPRVLAALERLARHDAGPAAEADLCRAVLRAAHLHPLPMLCLPQSLALAWMMRRRGHVCDFLIGARPGDPQLDAHAWVERAGRPINSVADSATRYPVLLRHSFTE